MKRTGKTRWAIGGALVLGLVLGVAAACVPADTRPEPGNLTVTVSPSGPVEHGFDTVDGWHVTFDRVLVGIGNASLSDDCVRYSSAGYDRILDAKHPAPQKLGILYGLGSCDVRFRISPPSSDAIVGTGVQEADKTNMRTPGSDAYFPRAGISVDIAGNATKGGERKNFHFVFRPRVRFQRCGASADGSASPTVKLESGRSLTYDIRIEAEALFRDDIRPDASSLRFEPFAAADKDGDELVTIDDLKSVPMDAIRDAGAFETGTYSSDDDGGLRRGPTLVIATLADYVYEVLLPLMPRLEDFGPCVPSINVPRPQSTSGGN